MAEKPNGEWTEDLKGCPRPDCDGEGEGEAWDDSYISCTNEACWFYHNEIPRSVWQELIRNDDDRQAAQEDAALEEALRYMYDGRPADAVCPLCNGRSLEPKVETMSAARRVNDSPLAWARVKCGISCDDCRYWAPYALGARAAWVAFTDHRSDT